MIPNMNAGMLIGGAPAYRTASADFDGTNDYMTRGAGLTGAVDGKTGIFSCWLRRDGGLASIQALLSSATTIGGSTYTVLIYLDASNRIAWVCKDSSQAVIVNYISIKTISDTVNWHHILMSWDLAASRCQLYVDDVADTATPTTLTNSGIDYTVADWSIGVSGTQYKLNGCLAELYFNSATSLDLSVVANRRKFRSAGGKPVKLGANGSTPTGSQPIIYQKVASGGAASDFATNLGSGGNFTVIGALTLGSSSPSD